MPVLVGFQAFCPASGIVLCDTDVSPKSGTFHTQKRFLAPIWVRQRDIVFTILTKHNEEYFEEAKKNRINNILSDFCTCHCFLFVQAWIQ